MLNWSTTNLTQYNHEAFTFDEEVDVKKELMERNPDIITMGQVRAQGSILYSRGDFTVNGRVSAAVTLPSTRSLTPVEVPVHFEFTETYLTRADHADQYEDDDLLILLKDDRLDLMPAVKDNVLLGLPLRVLTPAEEAATELPHGDNWALISEEEAAPLPPEERADNPFAGLQGLFDENNADGDKK